jgi:branched-chain amino acid transport system substrate-binding protein
MKKGEKTRSTNLDRREFLKTMGALGAATMIPLTMPVIARGADNPIKIGLVLPYSGVWSTIGTRAEQGIRYAIYMSKYRDRVKFLVEDSREDPAVSVEKAQKLVERENVDILVGPAAGHTALAVSEYCKSKKKLMLLVYGGNVKIAGSNCSRYTFLCGHTTYSVSAPGIPWMFEKLGKEIFLIGNDYSSGRDICGWFKEGYLKRGGTVVGEVYPPLGTSEFAPFLSQIQHAKPRPKVVAGFLSSSDTINLTKQYAEFGLKKEGIPIVSCIGTYSAVNLNAIGDAAEDIAYDIHHWAPTLPHKENVEFMNGYEKFAKMEAEDSAVLGYEVGTTIAYGLDQTGGNPDNEKLIDAIVKRQWVGPRGKCSFGPNHCVIHSTYIRQVKRVKGKLEPVAIANLGLQTTPGNATGPGGQCKM